MNLFAQLFVCFSLIMNFFVQNSSKKLLITGFENEQGKAFIEVLNEKNEAIKRIVAPIQNKQVHLILSDLHEKKYAIKVYHDENNNRKLDFNIFGAPTEAWGVTNNVRPAFRGPTLQEMLVDISIKNEILVRIK